jgi:hypothetical protein
MSEELILTTPVSVTGYRVKRLVFNWEEASITVIVSDTNNVRRVGRYDGPIATTLMNQLNTVNLTTNSLHKRILERLVTDGKLPPGTVTGTPDV